MSKAKNSATRKAIIAGCLHMNGQGINQGTAGNISVRTNDGFLITPSGVDYEKLQPGQIVAMTMQGDWDGDFTPSSEWRMHRDIYKIHADAAAIVHAHPTFCTTLACMHENIPPFHYMVAVAGGVDIRCAKYATFGSQKLSDNMLQVLQDRKACLLANHGMICFNTNLAQALALAVEVETLARQYWHVRQMGKAKLLSSQEMKKVIGQFANHGQNHE